MGALENDYLDYGNRFFDRVSGRPSIVFAFQISTLTDFNKIKNIKEEILVLIDAV